MKHLNKIAALALAATAFTACDDLDTEYLGGYVTAEQKQQALEANPDMASASVAAISSVINQYGYVYDSHYDFGYPGVMIGLDCQTAEYATPNIGYNHFNSWCAYSNCNNLRVPAAMAWYYIYAQIKNANDVAAAISADAEDGTLQFYRAQAVGTRAFDYWVLAQLFQYNITLVGEDAPCVPLITDENSEQAALEGAPRASLKDIYAQIISDATEALELLDKTSVTASDVIDSKPKRMLSKASVYGIRARAYMSMHKYAEAAADAQAAISNFAGQPASRADVAKPTFTSLDEQNWMWGIAMAETDRPVTTGICNFPSMSCSFAYGYTSVGAFKYASTKLYEYIPSTDVRKGWFLDENLNSNNCSSAQLKYLQSINPMPYCNVKFDTYQSVLEQDVNASDIPLMRIEEMYYILAEAKVMSGDVAGGKQTLISFVTTYRDPSYTVASTDAKVLQEEIFKQRAVELWGEGLTYFDYMRLDKGVDRRGCGWDAAYTFNIPSYTQDNTAEKTKAGVLIYLIPQGEINGNPAISDADNNLACESPLPVTE